jgi:predicted nucleic acid-binding protein
VGLIAEIGEGPAALDTAAFIYWIEESPSYFDAIAPVFHAADRGALEIVTSALKLLEVLVVPYRAGNVALAERYLALLTRSRGVRLVDLDRDQLRAAAQLRALHGLRTPDALQLSAALSARCPVFVTNDRRLPVVAGLRILQLRDFA